MTRKQMAYAYGYKRQISDLLTAEEWRRPSLPASVWPQGGHRHATGYRAVDSSSAILERNSTNDDALLDLLRGGT